MATVTKTIRGYQLNIVYVEVLNTALYYTKVCLGFSSKHEKVDIPKIVKRLVEDLKKCHAGEIKYLYDFVHEGEQYHASISVKRHEEKENDDSEN